MTTPEKCYSAGMMCKRMNKSFEASDFCGPDTQLQADNTCGVSEEMVTGFNAFKKQIEDTQNAFQCTFLPEALCDIPEQCQFDQGNCVPKAVERTTEETEFLKGFAKSNDICSQFSKETCPVDPRPILGSLCELENDACIQRR